MYYEVYADSLFLLSFTMNLYLLLLLDRSLHHTATGWRLVLGAAAGGAGYVLAFLIPFGGPVGKTLFLVLALNGGILYGVYRPSTFRAFLRLWELALRYCLLFGGVFFLLANHVKVFRENRVPAAGLLACAGLLYLFTRGWEERKEKERAGPCEAVLKSGTGRSVTVKAIVDTGNCLREPISGRPVSVLDRTMFEELWDEKEKPEGFRVVPYRSVGCENGILAAYEVPEMLIRQDGFQWSCKKVYVGLNEGRAASMGDYGMLIHPELLKPYKRPKNRKTAGSGSRVRGRMRGKHDIQSKYGKNTV